MPQQEILTDEEKPHFLEPLIVLARRKFFILWFVLGAALVSAVVSLLLPTYFTATTKILPPQQNQSMSAAMLSQLGQLGPLLGAAGKELENATEIVAGKDGIISLSVEDRSPDHAAEMANAYIEELENLTRTLAVSDAGKRRLFFEREVKAASDELATAELSLKQTEESTGIIQLDSQSKVMLQAYADLRAQVGLKQVQVQSMRSFATAENPDLLRAEQELKALQSQLGRFERGQGGRSSADLALDKVPGAGLEYVRKLREVKYRETLFELLARQYEAARIDEARDASIIQPLDQAVPPEKKSRPKRALIVLTAVLLAFLLAVVAVYIEAGFERIKE